MKRIIIIGAGFGGLQLAQSLINNKDYEVYLFDKMNHHQFQPLFYQVATSGLDASNISFPLRKIFHKAKNIHVRLATLKSINEIANTIDTSIGNFAYDYLVIATGADTNFFNHANITANALPMKSTVEALNIRNRLLQNMEHALNTTDVAIKKACLTICVVGGGPTGVELSGAIADMRSYILPNDYPEIDFKAMQILLFEGSPTTLENMSIKSQEQSMAYLSKMGVTLKVGCKVTDYNGQILTTNSGELIPTKLVIWAAGIKGNVPQGIDNTLITRGNRILTNELCLVKGKKNIYAIGDIAFMQSDFAPNGHPQVASVAIQQAKLVANNFKAMVKHTYELEEFEYNDKGAMATVGRNLAVVDIPFPKLHFGGVIAWLIWMGLHLFLILGIKNKLFIFLNWIYNYFTFDQNLRLIFKKPEVVDNTE